MLVTLIDPVDNKSYTIDVSIEEARRLENDLYYAQEILNVCKNEHHQPDLTKDFCNVAVEHNTENTVDQIIENNHEVQSQDDGGENEIIREEPSVQRHTWTYNETLCLITSIESHYEDLMHPNPKIKKRGWKNVQNDLLSAKYQLTIIECKKKWSNLVQSYNKAKDMKGKTGRGPTRFHFYENIDNILGFKPSNCSLHTVDLGKITENKENEETVQLGTRETIHEIELCDSPGPSSDKLTSSDCSNISTELKCRKLKRKYTQKEENQRKQEKKDMQFELKMKIMGKKLELEERKVKALEEYIALKKSQ